MNRKIQEENLLELNVLSLLKSTQEDNYKSPEYNVSIFNGMKNILEGNDILHMNYSLNRFNPIGKIMVCDYDEYKSISKMRLERFLSSLATQHHKNNNKSFGLEKKQEELYCLYLMYGKDIILDRYSFEKDSLTYISMMSLGMIEAKAVVNNYIVMRLTEQGIKYIKPTDERKEFLLKNVINRILEGEFKEIKLVREKNKIKINSKGVLPKGELAYLIARRNKGPYGKVSTTYELDKITGYEFIRKDIVMI